MSGHLGSREFKKIKDVFVMSSLRNVEFYQLMLQLSVMRRCDTALVYCIHVGVGGL